ncbi:hypothetical protein HKBW3S42_02347, partial [Candidatus Hakubella thermalkaliphila]
MKKKVKAGADDLIKDYKERRREQAKKEEETG